MGIRAREPDNIAAVHAAVDLPIIGITKSAYSDGSVLITPGFEDVGQITAAGAHIIAVDATQRIRPNGLTGPAFLAALKKECSLPLMADISTFEEAMAAAEAGADMVAPTLNGYTPYSLRSEGEGPDWTVLERLVESAGVPVIMEGGIWTPDQARRALELGAYSVVVGTAITRPRVITQAFVRATEL